MSRLPVILELSDLVARLNALQPAKWNNRKVRTVLSAGGVHLRQREAGARIFVTRAALVESFPDFVESLEADEAA